MRLDEFSMIYPHLHPSVEMVQYEYDHVRDVYVATLEIPASAILAVCKPEACSADESSMMTVYDMLDLDL